MGAFVTGACQGCQGCHEGCQLIDLATLGAPIQFYVFLPQGCQGLRGDPPKDAKLSSWHSWAAERLGANREGCNGDVGGIELLHCAENYSPRGL
jgi:hypothetical protein